MADIKCPSCGKINPEKLEICQYCGAFLNMTGTEPLAPLLPGQFPEKKDTKDLEQTLPSWLRSARRADKENSTTPIQMVKPQPPLPAPKGAPAQPPAAPPAKKNDSVSPFDLLAGLAQASEEDEEVPDWLKNLQGNMPVAAPPSQAEPPVSPPASSAQKSEPEPELPAREIDWGFSNQPGTFNFDDSQTPADQAPDWLNQLQAQGQASQPEEKPSADVFSSAEVLDSGDLPDWLASLGSVAAARPEPKPQAPLASSDQQTPDWLTDLGGGASLDETRPEASASAVSPIETPDWLSSLGGEFDASAQSLPETGAFSSSGDLPDWMAGLQETPSAPAQPPAETAPQALESGLPDWLSAAVGEETPPPAAVEPSQAVSKPFQTGTLGEINHNPANQLPDFMAGLVSSAGSSQPTEAAENVPDWLNSLSAADAVPEAAKKAAGESQPESAGKTVQPVIGAESSKAGSLPSIPEQKEKQDADALLSMDLPDWLSGFKPELETQPAGDTGEKLSPADLPSWVQAMRPVETMVSGIAPEDDEGSVESQGPLAGFRSILPVQPDLLAINKPQVYPIKMLVDETQRLQVSLLENLLKSEKTPAKPGVRAQLQVSRTLRWVIFGVLALFVLLPVVTGSQIFPAPMDDSLGTFAAFYQTVDRLPDGARVLVVTDYQPGFVGEVEQASAPVMAHLVRKNAQVAFVSTSLLSTQMGERLAQKFHYDVSRYVVLGFLPGGAAGVQAFADEPQKVTGVDSLDGNLWQSTVLAGVTRISDFGAVVVLTDGPDEARLWIEQAGTRLENTPLLMVVSAQAGPMLMPYYASGQLAGLISGLQGGMLYEQNMRPGDIREYYWDGLGAAMLAALLLIAVGGAWNAVNALRGRKLGPEMDEARP